MAITPILALLFAKAIQDPWKPAYLPGGYSVLCPRPVKRMGQAPGEEKLPPGTKGWTVETENTLYVIGIESHDQPPTEPPDRLLAAAAWAVIRDGDIGAEKDLMLNGWP